MKLESTNSENISRRKLQFLHRLNKVELQPYFWVVNKSGEIEISGMKNNCYCKNKYVGCKIFNGNVFIHSNLSRIVPRYLIYN